MKIISKWSIAVFAAVVLASSGAWYLTAMNKEPGILFSPDSTSVVAAGLKIYQENCAACHGANLEGQPNWQTPLENGRLPAPPHNADGHTWHHSERFLFDIMKKGVQGFAGVNYETDMPIYDGILTDDEIIAVLSFIKSTWPDIIRKRHD